MLGRFANMYRGRFAAAHPMHSRALALPYRIPFNPARVRDVEAMYPHFLNTYLYFKGIPHTHTPGILLH
jgi:hypothetical protein